MAKHRTARQWASILESYERSGLTQGAFCQCRGLALSTLSNRLRRHRATTSQCDERAGTSKPPSSRLLELIAPADSGGEGEPAQFSGEPRPEDGLDVRIELPAQLGGLSIHCRRRDLGEVLRQIPAPPTLTPNTSAS